MSALLAGCGTCEDRSTPIPVTTVEDVDPALKGLAPVLPGRAFARDAGVD